MKTNKNLLLSGVIIAIFMFASSIKAQGPAYREDLTSNKSGQKKVGWQSLKLDDNENNMRNGVEFYVEKAECTTKKPASNEKVNTTQNESFDIHHHTVTPDMYIAEKVTLLKLVNTNNYAVKVSYQETDFGPVVNVLVPPSTTIEGACANTDGNLAKLIIKTPVGKTDEEKQKQKSHIKSSLMVTQIQ